MEALEFKAFLDDNDLEFHYYSRKREKNLVVSVPFDLLHDFVNMIVYDDIDYPCQLNEGYVTIKMNKIFEAHNIELDELFDIVKPEKEWVFQDWDLFNED